MRRLQENGVTVATELKVPLSDKASFASSSGPRAVTTSYQRSRRSARSFALSKTVTLADEALIAEQYFRTAQYAGQYGGVSEAVIAGYGANEPEGLKTGTKVLLGIVAFFFVLWLVFEKLL